MAMNRRLFSVGLGLIVIAAVGTASCWSWPGQSDDELVYVGPTEQGVAPGEFLPGTDVQYVGLADDDAELRVGEKRALKKKGDSLDWDGHPMSGVTLNLNQRIIWFTEEKLHAAGTARLAVDEPQPEEMTFPEDLPVLYKLPVTYNVKQGEVIPGTTISYVGSADQGAELDGVGDYRYRKIADSIAWEGRLREGVYLQETLRVAFFTEEQLQVAGLATIGLQP
jgi:hypothetical protein